MAPISNRSETESYPASILYKSIAGRNRPVSYPDWPITARYRFIKNAYWVWLGYIKISSTICSSLIPEENNVSPNSLYVILYIMRFLGSDSNVRFLDSDSKALYLPYRTNYRTCSYKRTVKQFSSLRLQPVYFYLLIYKKKDML